MDWETLREILRIYGPTGREEKISQALGRLVTPYADEVYNDTLGNLIAVKRGVSGKKLMFSAHMDQVALIVVDIDKKGFLKLSTVGGINPVIAAAREVVFENGVRGVTYFENSAKHGVKDLTREELYADIGSESREEAEKLIDAIPGMSAEVYHDRNFTQLAAHYQEALGSHSCSDLIELVMSIYAKKQYVESRKRKFGQVDARFMKRAENLLYGEFSVALGIPFDDVQGYIAGRVSGAAEE